MNLLQSTGQKYWEAPQPFGGIHLGEQAGDHRAKTFWSRINSFPALSPTHHYECSPLDGACHRNQY